jgi:hypothetical protein
MIYGVLALVLLSFSVSVALAKLVALARRHLVIQLAIHSFGVFSIEFLKESTIGLLDRYHPPYFLDLADSLSL